MSNNKSTKSKTQMAEAPASWNTRYISPEGFECQLTLRAESGSELLEKVNSAIGYLLGNDCVPYTYNRGGYRGKGGNNKPKQVPSENTAGNGQSNNPAWCSIHECEMKRWEKDGRVWFSHKADDDWCKGK
jgi:hypothetical protein